MSETRPTWQRPVLLAEAGSTCNGTLRSAIRWALVTIDTQQAEIERLTRENAECRRLLREAVEFSWCDDEWWGNNIEDEWFVRAAKAGGDGE